MSNDPDRTEVEEEDDPLPIYCDVCGVELYNKKRQQAGLCAICQYEEDREGYEANCMNGAFDI